MPYNRQLIEHMSERISNQFPGAVVRAGFMNVNKPTIVEALAEVQRLPAAYSMNSRTPLP